MLHLEDILGEKKLIETTYNFFDNNTEKVIAIEGNSGTGKSYIANRIAQLWDDEEVNRKSLFLVGDISYCERNYYPFGVGLKKAKETISKYNTLTQGATELVRAVPIAGDFVSFLFDYLMSKRIDKDKLNFLLPEELDSFITLSSLYKKSELLVIADNFHVWDEASIKFLNILLSKELYKSFPFIEKMKILLLITSDRKSPCQDTISSIIGKYNVKKLTTEEVKQNDFDEVLRSFGIKNEINPDVKRLLFSLTNGHLELIKKLADYISNDSFTSLIDFNLTRSSNENEQQEFIEKILILRLQQLGADGDQIIKLLEYASVVGINFSYEEIACLTKDNKDKVLKTIQKAKELSLLNDELLMTSFSHEIIRDFFLCRIGIKKAEYYKRFAYCLRILRPAEYFHRAELFFEAGYLKEAITLYILGYLKNLREGLLPQSSIQSRIDSFVGGTGLKDFFIVIKDAYHYFQEGDYLKAKSILQTIEDIYHEELLAEKYYLLSLCLTKSMDKDDLIEAKNCLLNWDMLKDTETELWMRIMLTLLSRYAHMNDYSTAAMIERKVMLFLSERIKYDPSAEYGINVLRRKSSILHISEIASKRTFDSIKYFEKQTIHGSYDYPIQYYMAISNHSGNLIAAGDFENGYKYAAEALLIHKEIQEINFPCIAVPVNNFILGGYLSKNITSEQAVDLYDSLFNTLRDIEQKILLRNNYAIMNALKGNISFAYELLAELTDLLEAVTRKDLYYEYFVGINLSVIKYLLGDKNEAKRICLSIQDKIPSIPDKNFLVKRHQLIKTLFDDIKEIKSPVTWIDYILYNYQHELGPGWKFWGKGFLFSDMQFWSDS